MVDLQEAILQTDLAQKRLAEVGTRMTIRPTRPSLIKLKKEFDELVKEFQKDAAVMSQEQQLAARKKLASKQADLEHVTGKLQKPSRPPARHCCRRWRRKYRKYCAS